MTPILTFKDAKAYRDVTIHVQFYTLISAKMMVPYVMARDRIDDETFRESPVWLEAASDMEDVVERMKIHHDGISEHQTLEDWRSLSYSHFFHNGIKIIHYFPHHQIPTNPFELWFARFDNATFFGVRNLKP